MADQTRDDLREAAAIVREDAQFAEHTGRTEADLERMASLLERLANTTEMPAQFRRYTVTRPDGHGFDVWVRNLHEATVDGMDEFVHAAGWDAYAEESDPSDVFELFRTVEAHPDYVFGTIFTPDDFPGGRVPADFSTNRAKGALAESGNEYIAEEIDNEEQS